MDWKRIGRAAMCFLVICCLLFGLSPIKAEAVVLETAVGTAVAVAGGLVVASVIIGLGVQAGAMTTAWDSLVNDCHQYLISEGLAELDGTIKVMAVKGLAYSFAVSQEIIEAVRSFLFASGAIQETVVAIQNGNWYYNGFYAKPYPQDVDLSVYPYVTIGYQNYYSTPWCIFSSQPLLVDSKFSNYAIFWRFVADAETDALVFKGVNDNLTGWSLQTELSGISPGSTVVSLNAYIGGFEHVCNDMWANYDIFGTQYFNYGECLLPGMSAVTEDCTLVTTVPEYTAGTIASEQVDTEIGYDLWYGNGVEISTGTSDSDGSEPEPKPFWPIDLPANLTEAHKLQQEDVWKGSITTTDPDADPDVNPDLDPELQTGTLANTQVGTFLNNLLNPIKTALQNLGNMILDGLRDILVPKEDFLTSKVDALATEFAFAGSIVQTVKALVNGLSGVSTEPPVIYIDLGSQEGFYDMGGKVPFIDLRWYERYKPTVDVLIGAFLWICFLWRLLIHLPGIIGGASGLFMLSPLPSTQTSPDTPINTEDSIGGYHAYVSRSAFRKAQGLPDDGLGGGYSAYIPRSFFRQRNGNSDD